MTRPTKQATLEALRLVAQGHSGLSAARQCGIDVTTLYRNKEYKALRARQLAEQVTPEEYEAFLRRLARKIKRGELPEDPKAAVELLISLAESLRR